MNFFFLTELKMNLKLEKKVRNHKVNMKRRKNMEARWTDLENTIITLDI